MRKLTKFLKALANERRLEILQELMATEPLTVNAIAKRIGLSLKSTSKHLQKLTDCDFIVREQKSSQIWCALNHKNNILNSIIKHFK